MKEFDTICGIATAQGEGGIAIIRVSGSKSLDIVGKIFQGKNKFDINTMKTYTMKYGNIIDISSGEVIDEVIISYMKGPRSFTAEDVVEINCHGGVVSTNRVLEEVIKSGARIAEPGEFTKRAFLNGRIDLSQAEAVMDIITAKTDLAMKSAVMQSEGLLSKEINRLRKYLLDVLALIEYDVDFTEDDEEPDETVPIRVSESLEIAILEMKKLINGANEGNIIRVGLKVTIIGKPNVGKSSIINKLVGKNRVIVSDIAGTTRDAIDTAIKYNGKEYVFIDTAGLRRKNKIKEEIERYSIIRAVTAVERADVVIIVIDATEGVTEQDAKIAGIAHDRGKGIIIAVNKWDAIEKDNNTVKKHTEKIRQILSFMPYAEILFISAKSGQRLNKIFEMIDVVIENNSMRVATGVLNEIVTEAVAMQQPPTDKGKRLKIYYVTQVAVKPPTFVVFVNDKNLMHFSYTRYLENRIRDTFGFRGTALKFITRERKED